MLRWFSKLINRNQISRRASRTIARSRPHGRVRLGFDMLEDRTVPSASGFTINFPGHPGSIPVNSDDAALARMFNLFQGPDITISTPTNGQITNVNPFTVTGTIIDNSGTGIATATESIDGGAAVSILPLTGNNFSFSTGVLSQGPHTITVSSTDNANGFNSGSVTYTVDTVAPTITAITPTDTNPTNASTVHFGVTFSEAVTGLSSTNFTFVPTGSIAGQTVSTITGSGANYTVTVSGITGTGTLGLTLANSTGLADLAGNAVSNTPFTGATPYQIDQTAPSVTSINRANPSPTNATTLNYTVVFSEAVTNVQASNFQVVTGSGTTQTGAITVTGSGTTYNVSIPGVTTPAEGTGTLQLNLVNAGPAGTQIKDAVGNVLSPTSFTGQIYQLENGPSVSSTVPSPLNITSGTVSFAVTFDQSVTGVSTTAGSNNFTLVSTGTAAGTITGLSGSGANYVVTVNVTGGDGTLKLNVDQNLANIQNVANQPVTTAFVTGTTLNVDNTAPKINSIVIADSSPTNATTVHYTVTFSEPVTGVTTANFALAPTMTATGAINAISGSGSTYTVTVTSVGGTGNLGLNLANGTNIVDLAGNPLAAPGGGFPFVGGVYAIDNTGPVTPTLTLAPAFQAIPTPNPTVTYLATGTLQGVTEALANVTLKNGSNVTLATTQADASGNFTFTNVSFPNTAAGVTITNVQEASLSSTATFKYVPVNGLTLAVNNPINIVNVGTIGGVNFDGAYVITGTPDSTHFTVTLASLSDVNSPVTTGNAILNGADNLFNVSATDALGNPSAVFSQDIRNIKSQLQEILGPTPTTTVSHTSTAVIDGPAGIPLMYTTTPTLNPFLNGIGFDYTYDNTQLSLPTLNFGAGATLTLSGDTNTILLTLSTPIPGVTLQTGDDIQLINTGVAQLDGTYRILGVANGGLQLTVANGSNPNISFSGTVSVGSMTLLFRNIVDTGDFLGSQVTTTGNIVDIHVAWGGGGRNFTAGTSLTLPIQLISLPFLPGPTATANTSTTINIINGVPDTGGGYNFFGPPFTVSFT